MIAYYTDNAGSKNYTATGNNDYWPSYIDDDDYYYCDSYCYSTDNYIQEEPEQPVYQTENHFEKENFKYIQFKNVTFKRQL